MDDTINILANDLRFEAISNEGMGLTGYLFSGDSCILDNTFLKWLSRSLYNFSFDGLRVTFSNLL